jgi:hypothetical protein
VSKAKKKQQRKSDGLAGVPSTLDYPKPELKLVEAASRRECKLDLGCGLNPKEGFEGVDIRGNEKAKHIVDLFKFPWPFEDNSVDEIHASHLLEHVWDREVEARDLVRCPAGPDQASYQGLPRTEVELSAGGPSALCYGAHYLGADMLFAFMDECWRILKMGGWMNVVVPSGRSNRAFWDPTHRRFFMQETFLYFASEWRKINGLQHYRIKCNFGVDTSYSMPGEEMLRSPEAQQQRFHNFWNVTVDWLAKMQKQALIDPNAPPQIPGAPPGAPPPGAG